MDKNISHILISYEEDIPEEIPKSIIEEVQHQDLNLVAEAREKSGPFAGMEWLLPTAIVIFITRSYFDAFLKEMGKDHYNLLKKGILSVWGKLFSDSREINLVSVGTSGKIKKGNPYSLAFSIWSDFNNEYKVKFLFEDNLERDEFENNITLIMKFLETIHTGEGNVANYIVNENIRHSGRTILVTFDKGSKKLKMISPFPERKDSSQ